MKKLQRLLCLLLCLVFCLALLPAAALAEDADEDTGAIALVEDPAGEGAIAPATEPETLPAPGDEPNAGDVTIDAAHFPDDNFREFVQQYDTDSNGYLSTAELAAVTEMRCNSKNIADLTGIEHFTALTKLFCYNNQLTSLDLRNNSELETLYCQRNQLTSLDVSNNTALTYLDCYGNQLTFLDLRLVPALKDAVENGTRDTSNSRWDKYLSSRGTLYVDKTVTIITDSSALGIEINETNFPDANFRAFVKQYDTDSNGYLSASELAEVTSMDCGSKSIADLKGIEHFTALTWLGCYDNQLTSLDLSKNAALIELWCEKNQLTSLDVSQNTALIELWCDDNQLTSLDVSKNVALTYLYCYDNKLTSLDVSKNTSLTGLYCYDNQLTELDVSNNTELTYLECYNNQLTELDVSNNTKLTCLACCGNQLTVLDLSKVPALKDAVENGTKNTSNSEYDWYSSSQGNLYVDKTVNIITDASELGIGINAANFPDANFREFIKQYDTDSNGYLSPAELAAVRTMSCANESIADLTGIEHFTALRSLFCSNNELTSLDLSKNVALTMLNCDDNQLVSLDVSKNAVLKTLQCGRNQLTSLDVSANTALNWLGCENNYLSSLDLSAVPALKDAVENGTKDSSASSWDKYSSSQGTLYVDKTVTLITKGNPFSDVPDDSWYTTPVLWAISQDPPITSGTSDTTFGPNLECTRSQVVTFLYAAAGKPAVSNTNTGFVDVPSGAWFETAVAWAKENGITGGIDATHFGPDVTCTRAQVVTFLYAAAGKPAVSNTNTGFVDVPANAWYATAVAWAKETGVTGGTDATHFSPNMTCTRAQVVTFLYAAAGKPWG